MALHILCLPSGVLHYTILSGLYAAFLDAYFLLFGKYWITLSLLMLHVIA